MIDSSFLLLRIFVYQKIYAFSNPCNKQLYCSFFITVITDYKFITERGGGAEQVLLKNFKISVLNIILGHIFGKYTLLLSVAPLYEVDDETSPKQLYCNDRRLIYNRYFQFTI